MYDNALSDKARILVCPATLGIQLANVRLDLYKDAVGDHAMLEANMAACLNDLATLDAQRAAVFKGLREWAAANGVDIVWTEEWVRPSPRRLYRIIMDGHNFYWPDPEALYDAADAEILRLMRDAPKRLALGEPNVECGSTGADKNGLFA